MQFVPVSGWIACKRPLALDSAKPAANFMQENRPKERANCHKRSLPFLRFPRAAAYYKGSTLPCGFCEFAMRSASANPQFWGGLQGQSKATARGVMA